MAVFVAVMLSPVVFRATADPIRQYALLQYSDTFIAEAVVWLYALMIAGVIYSMTFISTRLMLAMVAMAFMRLATLIPA